MDVVPEKELQKIHDDIFRQAREEGIKAGFTPKKIFAKLAAIAFTDMGDFVEESDYGDVTKPISSVKPAKKVAAIKKVKITTNSFGKDNPVEVVKTEYELHNPMDAIKQATDLMGVSSPQKIVFPDKDGQPQDLKEIFSMDERIRRIKFIAEMAEKEKAKGLDKKQTP